MTNEERQRLMEFIREQQARFAANMRRFNEHGQRLNEDRIDDHPRSAELVEAFDHLAKLVEKNRSYFGSAEFRSTSFEDASQRLSHLVEDSKAKLARLNSKN